VFLPLNVDVPMNRLPIANWGLIAVIAGVSLIAWASPGLFGFLVGYDPPPADSGVASDLARQFAPRVFNPPWWKMPAVAFTASFVHANILHLAGNLFFLWIFGNAINYKLGHVGFLGLYSAGAILAGLASYWALPGLACCGASGAIMCVMGAFLVFFPRNDVEVIAAPFVEFTFWAQTLELPGWAVMLARVGWDILLLILFGNEMEDRVGYEAHIAGFVVGFLVAWVLASTRLVQPTRYEETLLQVLGIHRVRKDEAYRKERAAPARRWRL
jgi:membrane associated rhomboid family serine protease